MPQTRGPRAKTKLEHFRAAQVAQMAQVVCAGVRNDLDFVKFFVKHHHMDPMGALCGISRAFGIYLHVTVGSAHPKMFLARTACVP